MAKTTLVENDKKAGRALVKKLDESGFDLKAALWFYMPDSEEWRLILASTAVDVKGPKGAYEQVQSQLQAINEGYELSLQNISLVSPGDNLIKLLRSVVKTGKKISHIRFTRNVVNNVFIEDAYIYRLM